MPGVPHAGWTCCGIEDIQEEGGSDLETCQMCQIQLIRFVHIMSHQNYPELLRVGCVCAEHMAEDYDGRAAEKKTRDRSRRRHTYLQERRWHPSKAGNSIYYKSNDKFVVIVWERDAESEPYGFVVLDKVLDDETVCDESYETEAEAKAAAFQVLEEMRETRQMEYIIWDAAETCADLIPEEEWEDLQKKEAEYRQLEDEHDDN